MTTAPLLLSFTIHSLGSTNYTDSTGIANPFGKHFIISSSIFIIIAHFFQVKC